MFSAAKSTSTDDIFLNELSGMASSLPALVLGSGITALGVIRSLGRENIPVYYSNFEHDFAGRSRWCRLIPNSLNPFAGTGPLTDFLKGLPHERMVLFPCSDSLARAMAGLDPDIAKRFPSSLSSLENHDMLSDKERFADVLDRLGLPHPRTFLLKTREDLKSATDADFNDAFLKPQRSQEFMAHFGVKAFRVKSRREALKRYDEIHKTGFSVVLQEYIPGPPARHYFIDGFVDRRGRICARFVRQRLRMEPPDFGNSSYMITVAPEMISPAREALDRLLSTIRFRGIYSAEFKYDERDGLFKILEINSRPWWYIEFASICGVNVCKMAYDDALDRPVDSVKTYIVGRRCIYAYYDTLSCLRLYRQRRLTLFDWIKSWWGANQPEFSWNDPMPCVWSFLARTRSYFFRRKP